MKKIFENRSVILIVFLYICVLFLGGCGSDGDRTLSQTEQTPAQNTNQNQDNEQEISEIFNLIMERRSDGSPNIFNYAPLPEEYDENEEETDKLDFVKYVFSDDLNSDGKFERDINLKANCEYIIKYSHSGRNLNNYSLNLQIYAPDGREVFLVPDVPDVVNKESSGESSDSEPLDLSKMTEEEINAILEQSGMTLEELEREINYDKTDHEDIKPLRVKTEIDAIPEENPCLILYSFKIPLSGVYRFSVSEINDASGDISSEVPFEFRIYSSEESYSAFDDYKGEKLEFSQRDIIDIQRLLIDAATKFNENGLPVAFNWEEVKNSFVEIGPFAPIGRITKEEMEEIRKRIEEELERRKQEKLKKEAEDAQKVRIEGIIHNVPYDGIFLEGAGFYAHSGLRSINIEAVKDDNYSDNALEKFTVPEADGGINLKTKEKFNVRIIATQEEHDRTMELEATPNFALIRNALSFNGRKDYARLGSAHTKVISVKYDVLEEAPRIANDFQLTDGAMRRLQRDYGKFWREYGDYFVAGYTWGLRFEGIIEVVADSGTACDEVCSLLKKIMEYAQVNAYSERISGAPAFNVLENMNNSISELERNYRDVSVLFHNVRQTGGMEFFTSDIRSFINSMSNFIKNSPNVSKKQYERLFVTLERYREIDAAKPYIDETISIKKDHYQAIRKLTEKIFLTNCYYNALMAIPSGHLAGGMGRHQEWEKEFKNLIDQMEFSLNQICADTARIKEYDDEFEKLFQKYKALAERYNFYRYLVYKQQKDTSPSWSTSDYNEDRTWERGIYSYDKSSIVRSDFINVDYNFNHAESWTLGTRTASFSDNFEANRRISWFKTGHRKTNYSRGWDQNGTTLGKNSIHWEYRGSWGRRLEVFLTFRCINMPLDKYPFVGL